MKNLPANLAPYVALVPLVALMHSVPLALALLLYVAACFVALVGLATVFGGNQRRA